MKTRISREKTLMAAARLFARRSTCLKRNGAIIAREGRIISVGYAGSPRGFPHCIDVGCLEGPDGGCLRTIHAEANSIAMAARFGISTEGTTMYCTSSPCMACAKLIINTGISRVIYDKEYRDPRGISLLKEAGVLVGSVRGYE